MPWWNTPPEVAAPPVTLERVCAALRRLGLDPVVRDGRTQVVLYRYPCTLRLLSPGPAAPDQSAPPAPGPVSTQADKPAPDRLTGAPAPEPAQVRLLMESRYTVGLTQEAAARLAAHLLEKNSGRVSPTLLTAPGPDGIDVVGRAWCTVTAGMSDPQLRTTLRVWCESTLHALDELSETQGLPLPPDPTEPPSPGPTDPAPTAPTV